MGFRGRRLDAGGWTPGAGPGGASRFGRRGGRTDGVAEEAAWAVRRADGRSGGTVGWDGRVGRPNGRMEGMAGPDWKSWEKSRPDRDPARQGSVRPTSRPAKRPFRQGSTPTGAPPREGRTPSRSGPPGSRPVKGPFGQPPGQPNGHSVKVPARRSFSPGGSLHPFFLRPPFLPFISSSPLRRLLPLRHLNPSGAPPLHPAFRCGWGRRGCNSTAGGGTARAKGWNGISGAERGAATASGAPLPRPPGSRPEPTPGRQTSRKGERGVPEKGKNKEQERVFEQKGP